MADYESQRQNRENLITNIRHGNGNREKENSPKEEKVSEVGAKKEKEGDSGSRNNEDKGTASTKKAETGKVQSDIGGVHDAARDTAGVSASSESNKKN